MRTGGRTARYAFLTLASFFGAMAVVHAEHLTGTIVGSDGKPIPWIKERVLNSTTNTYETVLVPSVQIQLTVKKGPEEPVVGLANAEPDGSFVITWNKDGDINGLSHCKFMAIRSSTHSKAEVIPTEFKLRLTSDAKIDPMDPENSKYLSQPIIVRSTDEESTSKSPNPEKGKKSKKGK